MYDVIVVGARCAGSPLAMLLARSGYRVLVLDRDRLPSDMVMSTHLVHQRGVACLGRWGLRDEVAAQCCPIADCHLDLGPFTLSGTAPAVGGEPFALAPRRRLLDAILLRAAAASGAEIRDQQRVNGLLVEDDRVVGVRGVSKTGRAFTEKARLVAGADGPSSRVARSAGAEEYNARPALQATAWMYWDGLPLQRLELHQREHAAIYAFPSSGGCTLIGANWAIERFKSFHGDIERAYFELLRDAAPELADKVSQVKRADDRVHLGSTRNFFRRAQGPGWVLLGDARCKKDPCTAQGITDAFCDAEAVARAIDAAFCGRERLGAALADYERDRVAWDMPFYEFTCQLATFEPPSAQMRALYAALQGNRDGIDRFIGLITEATSPEEFFAPDHIARLMRAPTGDA